MLTVKFMKYGLASDLEGNKSPSYTEHIAIYPAKAVYIECSDTHGRQVVGVQHPTTGEIERYTIAPVDSQPAQFNAAYVMNENGQTVETVR